MADSEIKQVTVAGNDSLYENEDSGRVVRMLDGKILAKRWGMNGLFTYSDEFE
jgi:hypothetical protein